MISDELVQPAYKKDDRYGQPKREVRFFCVIKLNARIKEAGAAGYILLWLLGIPLPILFVIFLVHGCT
jgi:hypothetical protein